MEIIFIGIICLATVLAAVLYMLPGIIAGARGAENENKIYAVNFFLGWTVLGWIAALAWAVTDAPRAKA